MPDAAWRSEDAIDRRVPRPCTRSATAHRDHRRQDRARTAPRRGRSRDVAGERKGHTHGREANHDSRDDLTSYQSTSPPDDQHQADDQDDHVREVRVEAAGLQDFQSVRPRARSRAPADCRHSARRSVRFPRGSAPPAGNTARLRASASTSPRRPIHRLEDHHQRLGKCRRGVFGAARSARRRIPRSARAARRARSVAQPATRDRAEQRDADAHGNDVIERGHPADPRPSPAHPVPYRPAAADPGSDAITPPSTRRTRAWKQAQPNAQHGEKRLRHQHHRGRFARLGRGGASRQGEER